MSWIEDALNTPEAAATEFVRDELQKAEKMLIAWTDEEGIWHRASEMSCLEAIGILEAVKAQIIDRMWNVEEEAHQE